MVQRKTKKAVVLLSGGLDSATTLYYARSKGYELSCLIFDYGQRHRREIIGARMLARKAGARCVLLKISLPWKGSSLLDAKQALPPAVSVRGIPTTYVPARNTIFLSFAFSYAEAIGAQSIFIGANALDFSGYPDCRPAYYKVFNSLSRVATRTGIEKKPIVVHTPLLHKTKKEIVLLAKRLGVPLALTWSCYQGGRKPCGKCDSCRLRAKGFAQAGVKDPLSD